MDDKGETHTAIFVFTAVLIVACPCALALSIPFTFGNSMRIFGMKGLYIKNTEVIEKLAHIDTIVFDKTGTITKPKESKIEFSGINLSLNEISAIYSLVKQSTHPLSNAIANHFQKAQYIQPEHFVEVLGRGIFGRVNSLDVKIGSEEYVLNSSEKSENIASKVFVSINDKQTGYFKIINHYREGFDKVLKSLKLNLAFICLQAITILRKIS